MATKKENAKKALEKIRMEVICDATAGEVVDNIDDVVQATHEVLKACDETNYLEADAQKVFGDRDLLAAIKTVVSTTVKEAKAIYNAPFAVIDAKCKALELQMSRKSEAVEAIAAVHESTGSCAARADLFSYFAKRAEWMGPKYGPLVWAKHPTSWDKPGSEDKARREIDELIFFVRTSFRIIHGWRSPFEDLLLMRFCELSDLREALGTVYGYKEYLDSVAAVFMTGGSGWDGWSPELLYFDEDRVTEVFSITGRKSEVEAAKAAIAAMGAKMDSAPNGGIEGIAAWLAKEGFSKEQIDEAVADSRALGCTLEQVRRLGLDPGMSTGEIEERFFRGLDEPK